MKRGLLRRRLLYLITIFAATNSWAADSGDARREAEYYVAAYAQHYLALA
jgi:hypothetical protein